MSALNLKRNNLEGLAAFREAEAYTSLSLPEQRVLNRYWELISSGDSDVKKISEISGINDESSLLGGVAKVGEVMAEGIFLPYLLGERPYVFFYDPKTKEFYYFKNLNVTDPYNSTVEVLDISEERWAHVDDNAQFFGSNDGEGGYPGLIKAHFIYVQFNKDIAALDKIDLYVKNESLEPMKRGQRYFCQEQRGNFCQIHAANAFLGYSAVKPSALIQFIELDGFDHQNVEGLAAGEGQYSDNASGASNIEMGIDLGVVVQYLRHLQADDALRMDISNIKVGKVSYENEVLLFIDDESGVAYPIDEAFLAANSRAILGTYAPAHARALRKNTDGSWTEVDSMHVSQKVYKNLRDGLIETIASQTEFVGAGTTTLPCAFA